MSLIKRITNNTDQDIRITYKKMTDKAVYYNYSQHGERDRYSFNNIANDNIEITSARPLVYSVQSDNGVGGFNKIHYMYYGYVINKLRGSQGFHAIYTYDDTQRMLSETFYKQINGKNGRDFQYTGMPYKSFSGLEKHGSSWGKWASRTDIIYKDKVKFRGVDGTKAKVHQPYTFTNRTISYDVNSHKEISRTYHNNYLSTDGLGNIVKTRDKTIDKTTGKTFEKYSYNYYNEENENDWIIGRLTSAKVVHTATGTPTIIKSSSFEYDSDTGVLLKEVANEGTTQALTKSYEYDSYGNKVKETISGSGISSRSTTFGYSSDGKFQTSVTNAIGLKETKTYDARFGTLTSLTGPNGLKTTWKYDALGRKIEEKRADGTKTSWSHVWGHNYIGARNVLYSVGVSTSGKPFTRTYYDKLGREVGAYTYTMNKGNRTSYTSRRIQTHKYYNAKGELYIETMPHYGTDAKPYIRTYFDAYGRAIKETKPGPDGSMQTFTTTYKDFTTITTDPKGHKKYMQKDVNGKMLKVIDAYGTSVASQITYKYDSSGNLLETQDSKGNKIIMIYDELGNKKYMNDPDLGKWSYIYNALGQLTYQKDGNGATTYIYYDKLGRVTSKYALKDGWKNYNYYYNKYNSSSASKGSKGKLYYAYSSSKMNGKDWHGERKYYSYDSLGRTTKVRNHIYNKGDYNVETTYDSYSRPKTTTYPSGYKVTNNYKDGVLESVKGSDGKVHYLIDDLTALGQVSKATYGNSVKTNNYYDNAGYLSSVVSGLGYASGTVQRINYSYDSLGNVKTRNDNSITGKYINETYQYDAMNRLTRFDINSDVKVGSFAKTKTYKYDSIGNMTFQTGVGTYNYDKVKPHAVDSTKGATNYKFTYDKNGNMIHNRGRDIVYNPINKATYLKNKKGEEVSFYYGVGGQRYLKTNGEYSTYYIGKLYEEKVGNGYSVEKDYIYAGGKLVGTHKSTTNLFGGETTYATLYFHTDALNSVTAITNSNGAVIERRSYDPFGEIRSMDYKTNKNDIANITTWTDRAFTGHEQISELNGLVHMNARLYDNVIGRFLSADTIIQAPSDSQSYNRYSYVRNNPLMYTDPSGHSWLSKAWKKVKKHIRTIAAVAIAAVLTIATGGAFIAAYGAFWGAVATGALAGFASGAIMTGTLKGALTGAVFGAISAGVAFGVAEATSSMFGISSVEAHGATLLKSGMQKVAVAKSMMHGLTRGLISMARGGTFKSGFASGFTSSAFSVGTKGYGGFVGRTAIMSIVGGTASKLGGGKFSNGAVSGAFVHMFNAEQKGFIYGVKEFLKMIPKAIEYITFRGEAMNSVPYDKVGADAVRAVQNAHPAAQAVCVMAGTQVVLGGIYGTEALYYSASSNPIATYQFAEAALNPSVTVAGTSSFAARIGQTTGYIIRQGF